MRQNQSQLPASRIAPLLLAAALAAGCQLSAARRAQLQSKLDEESRVLTTAVVDLLDAQPDSARDAHSAAALSVAKQDQRVEGLPIQPIDALALLDTNSAAARVLQKRFAIQNHLIAAERALTARLVSMGAEAEEARRERRLRWTKILGFTFLPLAALAALAVFCPVAIPLLGRFLGWIVSVIPSLAKATGVVSVKAFDAVVRAIEKTRRHTAAPTAAILAANASEEGGSRRAREDAIEVLLANLSREMDADHKALVRLRRAAL